MFMKIGLSNPFNYSGSKFRYLKDLVEVLPKAEGLNVADFFYGGGDLSSHLPVSWTVDAFDINKQLLEMHEAISWGDITVKKVEDLVEKASLDRVDAVSYNDFRSVYNWSKCPVMLYTLLCHSNTNRIRFNKEGKFNVPFGRRTFNDSMKAKLTDYIYRLSERNVSFYNTSYREACIPVYDLLLVDPPYLNTVATYTENGGWTEKDEIELHITLHEANDQGKKFVYFGQTSSNGVVNPYLTKFASMYNMKVLRDTTSNCSANRRYRGATVEIMVWN
jgi:DNA adenine methylase Dam